jgi:hypothetical protein
VTLGNDHRPLTRDSAIYKGGTNHGESNQWGASPFVQALVPDRHYFFASGGLGPPIDVSSFRYLLFVSREPPERLDVTEAKLVEQFGLSLIGFECPLQLPIPGSIHYGCRRRPDAPIEERQGTVGYAWAPTVLAARGPVALAGEGRRRPQVGEATYTDATGEIWRLDPDGSFTRLHGSPGQRVRIDALGSWQKGWDGVAGLDAIFDGTHWEVGDSPRRPINRNPTLRRQPDSSIRGWEVLMREAVTVDRRPGAGDPQAPEGWLELAARRSYGRVGVRSGLDVDDYPGAPLTVVAVARAFASAPITVRIGAAAPQNTVTVVGSAGDDARTVPSSGEWTTLMVRVEPDQIVGERVAVIVELVDPKVGDRLDVSRVEIYAGRYPGP